MVLIHNEVMWDKWLNEMVYMDTSHEYLLPRWKAIELISCEGLIPFIEQNGYYFKDTSHKITKNLMYLMFSYHINNKLQCNNTQIGWNTEHYNMYCDVLDFEKWDDFWNRWGSMEDFNGYAYIIRYQLKNFVWNWLNLERCLTTQEIEDDTIADEFQSNLNINEDSSAPSGKFYT